MSVLLRARRWSGLLTVLLLTAASALAQSTAGFGDWQLHLPTNRAFALADAGSRLYVAADDAFFFFDKELSTTQLLSRRDGLHDVGVSAVGYDAATRQTLVAYRNGNLDLIGDDGTIRNVTDILRKQLTGSKAIGHIFFNAKLAYLSTDFGLVVLDMVKREVRDTYTNIGPNGQIAQIFATAVNNGTLYAATSFGVLHGRLTDNLVDYRKWTTDFSNTTGRYQVLTVQAGRVYTALNFGGLFVLLPNTTTWQPLSSVYADQYHQLNPSAAGVLVTSTTGTDRSLKIVRTDNAGTATRLGTAALLPFPRMAGQDASGAFYVADGQRGLVKTTDGQQAESFVANAPAQAAAFSVLANAASNTVDVFTGGHDDRYQLNLNSAGFYEYQAGRWTNFTRQTLPNPQDFPLYVDAMTYGVRTPDGTLYIGTFGNGVVQWKGPGQVRQFTAGKPGVTLRSSIPGDPNYVRVTDVATDPQGNVWVVNRHPELPSLSGLHVYTPGTDKWQNLPYASGFDNLDRIVVDDNGYAWVSQSRKGNGSGLISVKYTASDFNVRYFSSSDGNLPSGEIYDLVKDRKGDIWAATSKGVAVFNDPSQTFLAGNATGFRTPIVRRGTGSGFPALGDEVVHAIAVDGGNRKWFGTDRGLWLFNEDADEALLNFTTANSPLPSNNIVDIDINDRTGEVFVVTDLGVVAYRGAATVTEGTVSCAKVSPNPVRTDFTGEVGISGVANNGYVKITDVTGKLVYQTRPSGGTVVWNLTDYNGRKVQSGVYLVLSSDADGKNGCISKVAVVAK